MQETNPKATPAVSLSQADPVVQPSSSPAGAIGKSSTSGGFCTYTVSVMLLSVSGAQFVVLGANFVFAGCTVVSNGCTVVSIVKCATSRESRRDQFV